MSGVTIKDIAIKANVSIATVSRVTRGLPVGEARKARVEEWMRTLGYKPNFAARTMRTKTSGMIACAVRGLLLSEMAPFIRSAEVVLRERGYSLVLSPIDDQLSSQANLLKELTSRGIDGALLTTPAAAAAEIDKTLKEFGAPVVVIDREAPPSATAVNIDHRHGINAAVDYLVSLGHSSIAIMIGSSHLRPGRARLDAYKEAMSRHGLEIDPQWIMLDCVSPDVCFRRTSMLFSGTTLPTALIAGGMAQLPAVINALRSKRLKIGEDVSLVSGCDSEVARFSTPAITSIRWDFEQWGRISAEMLCEAIETPEVQHGRSVCLQTELVVRDSCCHCPA